MSTLKEVKITEATADQLRDFGNLYLGLAFDQNTPIETMRTQIGKAVQNGKIQISTDAAPDPRARVHDILPQTAAGEEIAKSSHVVIRIASTQDPGGEQPVPVGVNGSVMLIPRDQDARVPRPFYEVLRNAVVDRYEPEVINGLMVGMKSEPRRVQAYPVILLNDAA